ncbi:hypothetical protein Taro_002791 [Colocasia esculenta]|uniref:Uncharacterized protein n=1 Tax=Colocasia esculenta TaxID=4460 RepID=A0A843TJT3_COLES|nr:hypothetical protein [Colocasia esculenta]
MDISGYKYPCPWHSKASHDRASQDYSGKRRFEQERGIYIQRRRAAPPKGEEGEEEEELEIARVLIQKEIQPSVCKFCRGGVDTPSTGVDRMLQTQGKMMMKWSSGVDTGLSSVDTSPSSQRTQLTGLYCVSTQPQVVLTLDPVPRRPIWQFWTCVDTLCSSVDTLRLKLNFVKSSGHVAAWGSRGSA